MDDSLLRLATRIQLRAVRRCGQLLAEVRPALAGRPAKQAKNQHDEICTGAGTNTRSQAARDAGLSKRQKDTALRVASVPDQTFEKALETDMPTCLTVTEMAEWGTRKKHKTFEEEMREMVGDRDPKEFRAATHAQGQLRTLSEWLQTVTPEAIVRGSLPEELPDMAERLSIIQPWLVKLAALITKASKK